MDLQWCSHRSAHHSVCIFSKLELDDPQLRSFLFVFPPAVTLDMCMFCFNRDRGQQSRCLWGWAIRYWWCENQNVLLTSKGHTSTMKACCLVTDFFFNFYILMFILMKLFQTYPESSVEYDVERTAVADNFLCLLYPTNILNCSWSFPTLQKESQLFVYIRYSYFFDTL